MLKTTKRRIESLERNAGIDQSGFSSDASDWSLDKRLRKLEGRFQKLCWHLNIDFQQIPEHTRLVVKCGPEKQGDQ